MKLKNLAKIENILIPLFILLVTSASILFSSKAQIALLMAFFIGLMHVKNLKVEKPIIDIAILWILINILSYAVINRGQDFSLVTVFSRFMKILLIYFIVKLSGEDFYDRLNKHVFILTLISLPLFLIQVIAPSILFSLGSIFKPFTLGEFSDFGNWYSYVYMFNIWHLDQNSGFMWEPGAFAGFMIFMITYRLSVNNFAIDKYIIVYLVALLTTISTAGFLALSVLFVAFYIKERRKYLILLFVFPVAIYMAIGFYNKSEFLSGKVDEYIGVGTNAWGMQEDGVLRTTRLGYAMIIFDESLRWPFGHGIIDHSNYVIKKHGKIFGPGALSAILHRWGWIGLLGVFWLIYKFYRRRLNKTTSILFTGSVGIILFSNPHDFLLLIYSIIFYMICFGLDDYKKNKILPSNDP